MQLINIMTNTLTFHAAFGVRLFVLCVDKLIAQDSPTDSLATLHPADGVEVSLWASEPMVNNPTSMDIDSRGRIPVNASTRRRRYPNE